MEESNIQNEMPQEQVESKVTINDTSLEIASTETIIAEVIKESFSEFLVKTLSNEESIKKIEIHVNNELIECIKKLGKISPSLNEMESALSEIVKDGKINTADIPVLIVLVQKLYKSIYDSKDIKLDYKKRAELVGSILKLSIHILVIERKISVCEEKQNEFLKQSDCLVDACVGMLGYARSIKTKSCVSFLVNFFSLSSSK